MTTAVELIEELSAPRHLATLVELARVVFLLAASSLLWKIREPVWFVFKKTRAPADFVFAALAGLCLTVIIFQIRYFVFGVGDNESWLTLLALSVGSLAMIGGLLTATEVIENLRPWRELRPYLPVLQIFADLAPLDQKRFDALAAQASERTLEILANRSRPTAPEDSAAAIGQSVEEATAEVVWQERPR